MSWFFKGLFNTYLTMLVIAGLIMIPVYVSTGIEPWATVILTAVAATVLLVRRLRYELERDR